MRSPIVDTTDVTAGVALELPVKTCCFLHAAHLRATLNYNFYLEPQFLWGNVCLLCSVREAGDFPKPLIYVSFLQFESQDRQRSFNFISSWDCRFLQMRRSFCLNPDSFVFYYFFRNYLKGHFRFFEVGLCEVLLSSWC